ncbi:E1 [Human papillomavirus type 177]|nr:E1 [Human papillomavirus type 177]
MADQGTDGEGMGCSGWFHVEAIVERKTGDKILDDEDDSGTDTDGDIEDLIDNSEEYNTQAEQEAAQLLYNAQQAKLHRDAVRVLKRKFVGSPQISPLRDVVPCINQQLSPQLSAISLNGDSGTAKRRLFESVDSGYGNTEVETQLRQTQVEGENGGSQHSSCNSQHSMCGSSGEEGHSFGSGSDMDVEVQCTTPTTPTCRIYDIMKSSNVKATLYSKFKEVYGLSFTELIRPFKSDKTSCTDWVCAVCGVNGTVAEGLKTLIQPYCVYAHMQFLTCSWGVYLLMLIRYKCGKNRETVTKNLCTLLNVPATYMLIEPPKQRSTPCALYWYRTGLSNISEVIGETPEWITRQTMVQHSLEDTQFDLSQMVQWAYDNEVTEDSSIAYQYALLAPIDSNAAAFLKSNSQAKYVKDCGIMCRHYKAAERKQMNMQQWIDFKCDKTNDGGDWKVIVQLLRYQGIEFMAFIRALKQFLKGVPKKNCIVIYGPPDTGKSYFGMSLMKFLGGTIISFVNSTSHFWLSPLTDAKVAMLDDATTCCWDYMDKYMRNALDGNPMCLDRKHKHLIQIKCPPLLITSNIDPRTDAKWRYLYSRLQVFSFLNPFPFDNNGNPVYTITDENWKSFFQRTWCRLELHDEEDKENDGGPVATFKCVSGKNPRTV